MKKIFALIVFVAGVLSPVGGSLAWANGESSTGVRSTRCGAHPFQNAKSSSTVDSSLRLTPSVKVGALGAQS